MATYGPAPFNEVACVQFFACAFIYLHEGPNYITRKELFSGIDAIATQFEAPKEALQVLAYRERVMSYLVSGMLVSVDVTDTRNVYLGLEKIIARHLMLLSAMQFFKNRSAEWDKFLAKLISGA
jgi:hypothetical protein